MTCGRCSKTVRRGDEEYCWYCTEPLCFTCWDEVGHCGHEQAEAINEASRHATPGQRAAMLRDVLEGQGEYEMLVEPEDPN